MSKVNIPGLPDLSDEAFNRLKPLSFYLGPMSMTVKPRFRCKLQSYHIGLLKGTLRFGLDTKLLLKGLMTFDTKGGLQTNVSTKATDVKFTPPTWMLFTQNFELGIKLEPEFTLKGGFGSTQDMEIGVAFRPYTNISIHQE